MQYLLSNAWALRTRVSHIRKCLHDPKQGRLDYTTSPVKRKGILEAPFVHRLARLDSMTRERVLTCENVRVYCRRRAVICPDLTRGIHMRARPRWIL